MQRAFLGFAAGVMIAASVWSLLIPAIEKAQEKGIPGYLPAAGGFLLGGLFLMILDQKLSQLHENSRKVNVCSNTTKKTTLLITAVTLHNVPEGMAVGLAFALAAQNQDDPALYAAALALAIGIGVQNFPEGAAIALPLKQEGFSGCKAFFCGSMSGIVEPVFGIGAVMLAKNIEPYMPWLLAFAAGAMIYVVAEELIPGAHEGARSNIGTIGVMIGFLIMMVLDVALG